MVQPHTKRYQFDVMQKEKSDDHKLVLKQAWLMTADKLSSVTVSCILNVFDSTMCIKCETLQAPAADRNRCKNTRRRPNTKY